jgi:uncharacterized membrane protein HdeD (DUF308 family)
VVGLGILALIIGVILWLTIMPAIGWLLMAIGVILIIAGILYSIGRKDLKAVKGMPKTADSVQQIPAAMKGNEGVR